MNVIRPELKRRDRRAFRQDRRRPRSLKSQSKVTGELAGQSRHKKSHDWRLTLTLRQLVRSEHAFDRAPEPGIARLAGMPRPS
jgi:hypothetical protein